MKKIIGLFLLAVLSAGCVAHMMETYDGSAHLFAFPNAKQGRGGVIRYLNTGLESWKRWRRGDAEKQMQHFCSGSYKIVDQGPRSKFGAAMPIGNSVSFEVDQYWYISFECAKQPAQ